MNNYDFIAPLYDRLVQLVFGNQLNEATNCLIQSIGENDRVLILGGGTGAILDTLAVNRPNVKITFLDSSRKMINRAQQRTTGELNVEFMTSSALEATLDDVYDVVITPYFLDMFKANELEVLFARLSTHIRPGSLWLFTDFIRSQKLTHSLLIKAMYIFFNFVTGSQSLVIPDYEQHFKLAGFNLQKEKLFMNGLVAARAYCLIEHQP